jgi:integration host factor subunit alpha
MAVTKADLAEHLFEELGLNKREAKDLVNSFFETIRTTLERGEEVKLSGFGNFELREKAERPGRNPKTGEPVPISARRVVSFHAGAKLKERMDGDADRAAPPGAAGAGVGVQTAPVGKAQRVG